jgi:hypothetical protein
MKGEGQRVQIAFCKPPTLGDTSSQFIRGLQNAKTRFLSGISQFTRRGKAPAHSHKIIAIGLLFSSLVLAAPHGITAYSSVVSPNGSQIWLTEDVSPKKDGSQFFSSLTKQDFYPGLETTKPPFAAFSSDGGLLAYAIAGEVAVLDLGKKQEVLRFGYKNVYRMAFFGRNLLLAARDSDVLQVSSIAGKLGAKFKFDNVGTNLSHLSLSADGKRGVLLMYSKGANFAVIVDFTKNAKVLGSSGGSKKGSFTTCAANSLGSRFACGTDAGELVVLDSSGKTLHTQQAFKTAVQSVVFAKNNLFASSETESGVFK